MNKQKVLRLAVLIFAMSSAVNAMEQTSVDVTATTSPQDNIMIIGPARSATTVTLTFFHYSLKSSIAYNEPGSPVFFHNPSLYNDNCFKSFKELAEHYAAQTRSVVVKEMSFVAKKFFDEQPRAMENFSRFIFLLGDPYSQALSLYDKIGSNFEKLGAKPEDMEMDPENVKKQFSKLMGHEALYELLRRHSDALGEKVVVIRADELCLNPKSVLAKVHERFGMQFSEEHLTWPAGEKDSSRWIEYKIQNLVSIWHDRAEKSTGFEPLRCHRDAGERRDFDMINNLVHREIVRKAYEENLKFYEKTLSEFGHLFVPTATKK